MKNKNSRRPRKVYEYDGEPSTEAESEHRGATQGFVWAALIVCCVVSVIIIVMGAVWATTLRSKRPDDNYAPFACFSMSLGWDSRTMTVDGSCSRDPDPGDAITYVWDWGDGTSTDGGLDPFAMHLYANPLPYEIELCVTDPIGHEDCKTQTFDLQKLIETTDTSTNPAHCGAMFNACPSDFLCCDSTCIPGITDDLNCGACGNQCLGGSQCFNRECVNTDTDPNNCGTLGNQCPSFLQCCGGECINKETDRFHCGQCENACVNTAVCSNSTCINLYEDPNNCGTLGNVCQAPTSACCLGQCVDTTSQANHCGGCGNLCPGGDDCINSQCIDYLTSEEYCGSAVNNVACGQGESCCIGVCFPTAQDPNNCGDCNVVCPPGQPCLGGVCIDTNTNNDHCGGLFQPCNDATVCGGGVCVPAPVCGDGVLDPPEECDDGNRIDGDGCTSTCRAQVCLEEELVVVRITESVTLNRWTLSNFLGLSAIFACGAGGGGGAAGPDTVWDGSNRLTAKVIGQHGSPGLKTEFNFGNATLNTPLVVEVGEGGAGGKGLFMHPRNQVPDPPPQPGDNGGDTVVSVNNVILTAQGGAGGAANFRPVCDPGSNANCFRVFPNSLFNPGACPCWKQAYPFDQSTGDASYPWYSANGPGTTNYQQIAGGLFVRRTNPRNPCTGGAHYFVGRNTSSPWYLRDTVAATGSGFESDFVSGDDGGQGGGGLVFIQYYACTKYEERLPFDL